MEEPSETLGPAADPEIPQTSAAEDSSDDSEFPQPEMLVKIMKKLSLNPSAKQSGQRRQRQRQRQRQRRRQMINMPVENRSEKILREVQSAFPKRSVRTLLSVQRDPIARMKRFFRIEAKLRSFNGNGSEEKKEPFRCLCTFCLYQGWDPSENAKIGKN
ncbi:developmental pluripotency-associated protein 3 [Meriones unguiculatus]|uniref:developmental pluripotency-associated protein 3 n=1 Tax=Meriones unguiculatus TaxID=10047 RepID=UPI00293E6CA2|nr:developmental pluripotency-associated protein 3 [Meriones unguiculatus]